MVSGGWRFKGWVKTVEGLAYVMTTSSHPLSLLYNDNQGWRPCLYEKCYPPGFRSGLISYFVPWVQMVQGSISYFSNYLQGYFL